MDFKYAFETLKQKQDDLDRQLKSLQADVKAAVAFTEGFLKTCRKHKIDKVSINVSHESIESSKGFAFGPKGSVFSDTRTNDDWPAIWRAAEDYGISGGCGNSGQHQITSKAQAQFVDGTYHFIKGKWRKVD